MEGARHERAQVHQSKTIQKMKAYLLNPLRADPAIAVILTYCTTAILNAAVTGGHPNVSCFDNQIMTKLIFPTAYLRKLKPNQAFIQCSPLVVVS